MTDSICAFLNMWSGLGVGRKGGKEGGVGPRTKVVNFNDW